MVPFGRAGSTPGVDQQVKPTGTTVHLRDPEFYRAALGVVLGARVLGEFGDDRTRFASPQSRKNYAGTSPITRASGRSHIVLARRARNRRLADALDRWAFCSLTHSPGARVYYDQLRGRGKTHRQALRQLANRWTGILHTCLQQGHPYNEHTAWAHLQAAAA